MRFNKRKIRDRLWKKQKGHCHYCDKQVPKNRATLEHLVPRAQGGAEFDPANLVMSCFECNNEKSVEDNPERRRAAELKKTRRRRLGVPPQPYSDSKKPQRDSQPPSPSASMSGNTMLT